LEPGYHPVKWKFSTLPNKSGTKTDEELLRLELVAQKLTAEANVAVHGELARRQVMGCGAPSRFSRTGSKASNGAGKGFG
jgi:hypothetical protein